MEQLIQFTINHPMLIGAFVVLLIALVATEARKGGKSVSVHEATRLVNQDGAVFLDVREKKDFNTGHMVDAVNIPLARLKERAVEIDKYKTKPVIVVDAMGQHSGSAAKILKDAGFENVVRLKGGVSTWQADNLPLIS
ncbi:rhodanese-like domain-containing protein [Endozoicomonadaceae bacterium StTr2]